MQVLEYIDSGGQTPFRDWFDGLDAQAAAKVSTAITRLSFGNTSNVKSVGAGILELKIDDAQGYRIYFGKDGEQGVILSCRRHQTTPAARHPCRAKALAGL